MVNNKKLTKNNTKSSPMRSKQSSRRNRSRKNKSRKNIRKVVAGTDGEPDKEDNSENIKKTSEKSIEEDYDVCCMCMKPIESKYFQPSKCLQKYASRAHKICGECWWGEFAKEGFAHECPGCAKNLPLPKKGKKSIKDSNTIEIDLTDE